MKNKFFPFFITAIFLLVFFIFYRGLQNPNTYTPKTNIKKDIPSFKAKILDTENEINSEEIFLNNRFYLMNIWASWCVPCKDEHVFLMNLSNQENLKIIGLNYKDNTINAKKFLKELGNPYGVIISDHDGTIAIEWGAYGVPETFLIYDKKIIKKIIGPLDKDSLFEIKKIIK